jgi:hypothetical protein
MMPRRRETKAVTKTISIAAPEGETHAGVGASYEPPKLIPVGNLHDLLAGATGPQCDQTHLTGANVDDNTC